MTSDAIDDAVERVVLEHETTDRVVLLEAALLGTGLYGIDGLIVVDAPEPVVVERLQRDRAMSEDEIRVRTAHQATREQRVAMADLVIDNGGDVRALDEQIAAAWDWLRALPDGHYCPRRAQQ
jgi:dephospho-CoA kinase